MKRSILCLCSIFLLAILIGAGALGCGGGSDGGSSSVAAYSNSFSPMQAADADGDAVKLKWVYRVNNGRPVYADANGVTFAATFDDVTMTADPATGKSTAKLTGNISGDASGSYSADIIDHFNYSEGKTLVSESHLNITMQLTADGEKGSIKLDLSSMFNPAVEWFLDRNDLDQMAIGHTHDGRGAVMAQVTGSVKITGLDTMKVDYAGTQSDVWEITDKRETMTVRGKTYANIVEVTRYTRIPDVYGSGSEPATIVYWAAKGIGWIKAAGHFRFQNEPLNIELVETNLAAPASISDNDGDGFLSDTDCNDDDASIHPGAVEICGDGIDQDCNGSDLSCAPGSLDTDNDGDGYSENQGDCDDQNSTVFPGAIEICGDGIDQDCNGSDLSCSDDTEAKPWIGNWILINFLGDDEEEWDTDSPDGIGMSAIITENAWIEQDDYSDCAVTHTYRVKRNLQYTKQATAVTHCPFSILPYDSGYLEFSNDNNIMIEHFDLQAGDTILAFKWMRKQAGQ